MKEASSNRELKEIAGRAAAELVRNGMVIGIGTGSTVEYTIRALAEKNIDFTAVPTSDMTEKLCKDLGIRLDKPENHDSLDLTIDGADEVNEDLSLIKGGWGALTREKIVAAMSKELVIVIDETKLVKHLGEFPLPIEVIPIARKFVLKKVVALGAEARVRTRNKDLFVTDNDNNIIDAKFHEIMDPGKLEKQLNMIPGVVENGLFVKMATKAYVGTRKGVKTL